MKVTDVAFSTSNVRLTEGETQTLSVTVTPEYATDKGLVWTSSNEQVVTVGADGCVTAVGAGYAIITATAADGSGASDTCVIIVKADGIDAVQTDGGDAADIYDVTGRLVKKSATSTEGLQKGVYLQGGEKLIVK